MKKGKIAIGIPSVRGTHVLPLILPKFKEEYPGIEINVVEGDSNYLQECLLSGKIDLILTSLPSTDKKIIELENLQNIFLTYLSLSQKSF